jgi:uncharacterized small protein (DUF1192 family)
MNLRDHHELEVTKEKLRVLEEWYAKRVHEPVQDEHVRQLSLQSIKKMINQLTEEIVRFEAREKGKVKNR